MNATGWSTGGVSARGSVAGAERGVAHCISVQE